MDTKKLRQKILDLAIHGRLVPQDPNDEPASVLLERIRAEKEQLIKEGRIKAKKKAAKADETTAGQQNVPKGWACCRFDELCTKFSTGPFGSMVHKSDYVNSEGVPLVNPINIIDGIIRKDKLMKVNSAKAKELNRYKLSCGDILIARRGDLSKCAIVTNNEKDWLCGTGSFFLHIPYVLPRYIGYVYSSRYVQSKLKTECVGATMDNLNQNVLGNILFLLPPLNEQRRIVAEIERWFALIDQIEQGKADLQTAIKQAKKKILDLAIHGKLVPQDPNDEPASKLLKRINPKTESICDNEQDGKIPFKLPFNWEWVKGQNIFESMKSTNPKTESFKYIDIDAIDNKRNIVASIKILRKEEAPSRASRYTEKGNVLFSMVRPYLRNIAMVTDEDCIASTGFYVCRQKDCLDNTFCYFLMLSEYVVDGLNKCMKGDNSPSINKGQIESYLFPLPPLPEQHRIVAKIEELFAQLDKIESALQA